MSLGKTINRVVQANLDRINSLDVGIISRVNLDTWTASVRLKHRRQGREIELQGVPIAPQRYGAGSLWIAPAVGDVVLVAYTRYDLREQLKNRNVVDVNEQITCHPAHALVIAGLVPQTDPVPAVPDGGILLQHQSGAAIEIDADGNMTIRAKHVSFQEIE